MVCHMPAARKGDAVVDPVYGPNMIASHSPTVFIGGSPAARLLDFAAPSASKSGKGVPPVVGPGMKTKSFNATTDPKKRDAKKALEEDHAVGPHVEGKLEDLNQDGIPDNAQIEGAGAQWNFEKKIDPNSGLPSAGGKFDGGVYEFKAQATQAEGVGGTLVAEGSMARMNVDGFVSDGAGSMLGGGGTGQIFHGVAGGEAWAGHNPATHEYGFRAAGGLKGEVLTGEVRGVAMVPAAKAFLPFLPTEWARKVPIIGDWNAGVEGALGGDVGAAGAAGKVEAVYNTETQRGQVSVAGALAAALGLKIDIKIFFEKAKPLPKQSPEPPSGGAPVISKGAPTVLIGP